MSGSRALTDAEIASILPILNIRDRALLILGVRAGFRISELLSLKVSDLIQHGQLVNRVTVTRSNMKGKTRSRSVALHDDAKSAITDLITAYKLVETDFLFINTRDRTKAISRVHAWRVLNNAYEVLSLMGKLGTHALRKSFAKRVYEASSKDLIATQHALGHSSVASTGRYLESTQEEVDDLVLQMKGIVWGRATDPKPEPVWDTPIILPKENK